jgi:hypothetical protein
MPFSKISICYIMSDSVQRYTVWKPSYFYKLTVFSTKKVYYYNSFKSMYYANYVYSDSMDMAYFWTFKSKFIDNNIEIIQLRFVHQLNRLPLFQKINIDNKIANKYSCSRLMSVNV